MGSAFVDLPEDQVAAGAHRLNVDSLADLLQEWTADGQANLLTENGSPRRRWGPGVRRLPPSL